MTETTIDVQALQALLAQGRPVTVLDVRHAGDYQEWAVPGSLNVDVYDALQAKAADAMRGVQLRAGKPVVTV
jgi:rhodanese-related sulfurtransferase